jgi:ABC-type sugar transport system permease subunit/ABC-type glycerol-3-phosphate transport system substrate-binding protein
MNLSCLFPAFFLLFATSASMGQVTLRVIDWAGLDEIPLTHKALARFHTLHPEITVQYEPNPGRQYEEKILTALAADTPPDVFLLDSKVIPGFANKKVLLDLSQVVPLLGLDTTMWFPEVLHIFRRDSALLAFPKGFTPLMVYYNRALFDQEGISYPHAEWTWADYLSIARTLTKDLDGNGTTDQYGTAFTNYYYFWIPWVWSAGGDVVSPDGTTATGYLNSAETETALQFLIDLRTLHKAAPDAGTWTQTERTGSNSQLFVAGKIAMIVDGHWRMPKFAQYIKEGTLRIGAVGLPAAPGKQNVIYASGWCIPGTTRHPREAAMLAAFLAGEDAARIRTQGRLEIPAVISVAGEIAKHDTTGLEAAFMAEIPFCRQPWGSVIERFSEIEWTLQDAVDEVMINGAEIHTTMTSFAAQADKQLEAIRSHEQLTFQPIREHSEILHVLLGAVGAGFLISLILYMKQKHAGRRQMRMGWMFLTPSLVHLLIFVVTPIVFSAYLSVHQWDIVVPQKPFVGFENFSELLADSYFWNALRNTLVFVLNVPVSMALALLVAVILHRNLAAPGVLRALFFLPSVTSFVAIALVWMWIYHPTFGMANFFLSLAGLPPLQWLNSSGTAMISLMIFSIWMGMGYQMVIFLAGLQGIPHELYEAAKIDGATGRQIFWRVTFPLLKPTTFFILIVSIIGSFQVFTSVYVMTAGGPVRNTDVIAYHIYQSAWEQLRMGYASAMAWVLFIIIMGATWLQFRFLRHEVDYV